MAEPTNPSPILNSEETIGEFRESRKTNISTHLIADTVHTRLRNAILSAELRPNNRLVEDELAEWLNVSRTPIREALLMLEQEGLVERQRGWVVREHNQFEIRDRLECRLALESYAARLVAIRRSDKDLQRLRELADAMEKPGISHLDLNQLNDSFHTVIILATSNPTMANLYDQTKVNYWNLNTPVTFTLDTDRMYLKQHRLLINAFADKNEEKAESIMRGHIQLTLKSVLDAFRMNGFQLPLERG
jgi:DNA-binding GntR family transcriptional regulator